MRSTLGRVTLRGASRLVSTPNAATRNPARTTRSHPVPRELCTNVMSTDSKRKLEDTEVDPDRAPAASAIPEEKQPNVEVIVEDATVAASLPTAAEEIADHSSSLSDADKDTSAAVETTLVGKTPQALLTQLKAFIEKNANRTALWHYAKAISQKDAPLVDADVMALMLPILGRNSWGPTALDTLELALDRKYDLGIGVYNCGLHAVSRGGDSDKVFELINRMWSIPKSSVPNATTYNYLISAFVYRGKMDEAFEVLNEMKKHLIYPTFSTYHALITGCLRRRDPRRAYQTLLAVEKQRFDISAMTIAQVLVVSANNDDYNSTLELLDKFEEALPRYSQEVHRIAEDRALYQIRGQQWTSKEDRATIRGEPILEIGAISNVLHCAFRGGRVDVASRAWALLSKYHPDYEIPMPLWYCLLGAYAGAGEFSKAMDIIGHMREQGLKLSLQNLEMTFVRPLSFDIAVVDEQFYRLCDRLGAGSPETFDKAGAEESAAERVGESADTTVGDDTAKVVSEGAADTDPAVKDISPEDASDENDSLAEILSTPPQEGLRVDVTDSMKPTTVGIDELNCIIAACSAAQDLDRAFQTYDEVESRFNLEKNVDTYNALLDGCVQTRHLRGGMRILEEMESVGMELSPKTVHLASRLMLRNGRGSEVCNMLRKCREDNIAVMLQTYQMVIRYLVRGNSIDEAIEFIGLGEEQGLLYHGLTARLDYDGASKLPRRDGDNRMGSSRNAMNVDGGDSGKAGESWTDNEDEVGSQERETEFAGTNGLDDALGEGTAKVVTKVKEDSS